MKQYRISYNIAHHTSAWFYTEASTEFSAIHNFEIQAQKCGRKITRRRTEEITSHQQWKLAGKTEQNTNRLICPAVLKQVE